MNAPLTLLSRLAPTTRSSSVTMVKQKHHTARNQTYKHNRNGIKKAPRTKFIKLSGVSLRAWRRALPPPCAARAVKTHHDGARSPTPPCSAEPRVV